MASPNTSLLLSREEERAAHKRVFEDAYDRLVIGPGQAFLAAGFAVFGVGCLEGYQYLRPTTTASSSSFITRDRLRFILRYGLAQVLPSIIWEQQSAATVARAYRIFVDDDKRKMLMFWGKLPPKQELAVNRLVAIRGAIAGTILIAQAISFASVANEAKAAYSQRIQAGREPPLHIATTRKKNGLLDERGVVIRLAGKTSDVTSLSMDREGRRFLFPVFEDASLVRPLLHRHGVKRGNYYKMPLFWNVQDKKYGYSESWSGLSIPQTWLFQTAGNKKNNSAKLFILEADANREDAGALSMAAPQVEANLDLDLYEVAQGFYQLQQLVEDNSDGNASPHQCLCVLLADAGSRIQRGGGEEMTVREYVSSLGLADIVIDSQAPIVMALKEWLASRDEYREKASSLRCRKRRAVILETPEIPWFKSMKTALKQLGGYEVIGTMEAIRLYGSAHGIPILVYERTTEDTKHTIRRLVQQGIVLPQDVCALCSTHRGLEESQSKTKSSNSDCSLDNVEIANICSSDLHDRLLRKVRQAALKGHSKDEIQRQLDENLSELLTEHSGSAEESDWKLSMQLL